MTSNLGHGNLGFLLAKATQKWNEMLYRRFCEAGYATIRPSYGSILVPLFEQDGLRVGELARRSRLSKQTMTTMVRLLQRERLVRLRPDPEDGRAMCVFLTQRAKDFQPIAQRVMAELERAAEEVVSKTEIPIVRDWLRRFAGV